MAQTDIHYCMIKFFMIKAGFSDWEAEIVAYASELVDHATDHKGIYIKGLPEKFKLLCENNLFEPVCTAHKAIDYPDLLFSKAAQEKVLISFHFLPSKFYHGGKFSYITKVKSEFDDILLECVKRRLSRAESEDEYILELIRLGIALHSGVDMFTHALFSGRHNEENDIENLFVEGEIGDQEIGIIPDIGHGELLSFPDLPFVSFTYENYKGIRIRRNNPKIFMFAAKRFYRMISYLSTGKVTPFSEFEDDLRECFTFRSYDLEERINFWREKFPFIIFNFQEDTWKNAAIKEKPVDLVLMARYSVFKTYEYSGNKLGRLWFLFHQAAFVQRKLILQHIRRL